jgi:acetyltransferase-like isoleucine patch superfamily enzyme
MRASDALAPRFQLLTRFLDTDMTIPRAQEQLFDRRTSAREKYASLVVGREGWGPLIKHELITLVAQNVPGALGFALRQALYPSLLGACGRGVIFGQNVVLRHPARIRIGHDVVVDDNCLLDAKGTSNTGITIGNGVFIGRNTILSCKNGDIEVDDEANIGFNCELFSASRVRIGKQTLLAAYCYVIGGGHDISDPASPVLSQARNSSGVTIGDGAWLGAGAKILDGVTIGDRAVIGAGAVVREAVPAGAVAVGVPARVVSQRDPVAQT